jgi:beta-mannosidase
MVWQDFAFACAMYPQNKSFLEKAAREVEWAVENLRGHASLILWCGDNECDQIYVDRGFDPNKNLITRKLIPEILYRMDPGRPYLPSSPFISEEVYNAGKGGAPEAIYKLAPERHLWGTREFFKLPFYSQSGAKFISEAGWHGCPGLSSLKKFLSQESLSPDPENPEWDVHASNPFGKWSNLKTRNQLLFKQLEEYFSSVPTSLEEFIAASQIFQAEAKKFLIENARISKECRGIIWWNVIDCWPQFSDAVVDYYFNKKLAFHYIKRSQKPLCFMFAEPCRWDCDLVGVNDTPLRVSGKVDAFDAASGKKLISKDFKLERDDILTLDAVRAPRGDSRLFLVKWESDFGEGINHYVSTSPGLSFELYLKWLPEIAALDDSFSPNDVGK